MLSPTNVEGLYLVRDFLRPEEESSLAEKILAGTWGPNRSKTRRIQTYSLCSRNSGRISQRPEST